MNPRTHEWMVYSLGQSPPDPVTLRPHLQMPSVWLWGIIFPTHEWILGHTPTRTDSLLLVIFKVCDTPCPLAEVLQCVLSSASTTLLPSALLSSPPHYCSVRAPTCSSLNFTCFPAVLYVFCLGLVVCYGFSSHSQHIHVKLVYTQFTGEEREAPRV